MTRRLRLAAAWLLLVMPTVAAPAAADPADVIDVVVTAEGDGRYRFDVTVAHPDEGWEHFADLWQVVGPDGTVLAKRELAHPHETEQPFTRSLSGIAIPTDVAHVTVQARCSVEGFGGREMSVEMPR